jgi:hypothetical protein
MVFATDPKRKLQPIEEQRTRLADWPIHRFVLHLRGTSEKGKAGESQRRKATGPRFLRAAMDGFPKDLENYKALYRDQKEL